MATPTKSPVSFASLPAECRNEIYYYTLLSKTPIPLPYAYEKTPFAEPALLSASAWIRAEAAPIFYGSNTFEAPSPPAAQSFLSTQIAANVALLKHFRPIDLIIPLSAHKRWLEALRWNINRLEKKKYLKPKAIEVPVREIDGEAYWTRLNELEDFQILVKDRGDWSLEWRDSGVKWLVLTC